MFAEAGPGGLRPELLFTENETNNERLFGARNAIAVRQGRVSRLRDRGERRTRSTRSGSARRPRRSTCSTVPAGGSAVVRLRLSRRRGGRRASRSATSSTRSSRRASEKPTPTTPRASRRRISRRGAPQSCARRTPGLLWSKQFYHYVVKDWLDGDPDQPPPPADPQARPQSRLAAPVQPRRDLDARQVGVSVVRGVGSGVPHDPVRQVDPRVRQGAARAVPARVVHAPQRPDAGVRVRVLRRESAGARVGRAGASTR